MSKIAILGAGSWGTALAQTAAVHGHDVVLWTHNVKQAEEMSQCKENKKYLPGISLHKNISFVSDIAQTVGVEITVIAIPAQAQRKFIHEYKARFIGEDIIVNVAKGLEIDTGKRLSTIFNEELGDISCRYAGLYGPSHAEEVGRNMPTALVAVAENELLAEYVQQTLMSLDLRIYTSNDLIGIEFGGALKNIIALAIGMTVGLGYGDNARAALMTRGLAEITRLSVALGANPMTFLGLTGVGDLIVTCTSKHSRNRTAGKMLGEGYDMDAVYEHLKMVVEGVPTTKAAYDLAKENNISMPIVSHMYSVLFEKADPREAAYDLMSRSGKSEKEDYLN